MTDSERDPDTAARLRMTTTVVEAYVRNHDLSPQDLTRVINMVHAALRDLVQGRPAQPQRPAVAIRKSVTPDYLICLEDGKKLKMLKRHLRTAYGMTPEDYRAKWGLSADYPMVAPNYAQQRSAFAKEIGLGRKPGSGRRRARRS